MTRQREVLVGFQPTSAFATGLSRWWAGTKWMSFSRLQPGFSDSFSKSAEARLEELISFGLSTTD